MTSRTAQASATKPTAATQPAVAQIPKSYLSRSRVRAVWLFLLPMLIVIILVAGWPLGRTIWFSFTDTNLSNLSDINWIGWGNYLSYLDYGDGDGEWIGVLAMFAVIMADVWKTTPFMALLILAALQMLPTDCYEAAKVDGIHPVRVFFKVTLPLLKSALMVAIIFRLLDALRIFDLIYVLTANSEATMSMSVYARQQLVEFHNVGVGSAASTLLFFIVALCTVIYLMTGKVKLN